MKTFRELPIKRKMSLAVLGTTTIALLVACGAFVAYERVNFRTAMERNLKVLAEALASNSAAAIAFANAKLADTKDDAAKILTALRAEPAVVAAALYMGDQTLHGTYTRAGASGQFPAQPGMDGMRIEGDFMIVVRPVISEGSTPGEEDEDPAAATSRPAMKEGARIGTIFVRADMTELNKTLWMYGQISALILVGSLALALVLSSTLQGLVLQPILALTETAKSISETRDYSVRARKTSADELGVLTDAFNQMLGDIQERTSALQGANESLRKQAAGITDAAQVLASSASQIVAAVQQLSASATEAASAVAQTTTTVEEVRQTSQMSSDRATLVSGQAQNAVQVAQGGKVSVNQTIEGMQGIRTQMGSIAESILSLSAQSQAIGEIIASVDDLAAQSKLLSVNAAIEAAKAGEEGRGFSVVAQEVKLLAEQSKQATAQVRAILNDIQKATGSAVLATEQGGKAVEAGVRQSTAAGESISALAESIAGAAQAAAQIAATSRQQFAGMEQVAMAMESIKSASTQTVSSTRQVETAARQLEALGEKLKLLAGQLKV